MLLYTIMDSITQIESPCVRNCCLDYDDICLGCFRSLSEITAWGMVDNQTRKKILLEAEQRKKKADKCSKS